MPKIEITSQLSRKDIFTFRKKVFLKHTCLLDLVKKGKQSAPITFVTLN